MSKKERKSPTHRKPRLNELDGKTWQRYSISIWDLKKSKVESKLKHPAMFPLELCSRLMDIYTQKADAVLDPFMGSGSVLVAAKDKERKGIGFDINPAYVKLAKKRVSQKKLLELSTVGSYIYCEDAKNLLNHVEPGTVDLVITSPPYWNIHTRKRTADYKKPRPYSSLEKDLGNIPDFSVFMNELKIVFEKIHTALKSGKRCIVVVMDIRIGSQFIPFHMDIVDTMKEVGFVLEDIVIWDRKKEYSNLRPLGYPYVFIVNKIHEYILIFRKKRVEEIEGNPS